MHFSSICARNPWRAVVATAQNLRARRARALSVKCQSYNITSRYWLALVINFLGFGIVRDILLKIRPDLLDGDFRLLCQQGYILLKLFFEHLPRLCSHIYFFQIRFHYFSIDSP